MRRRLALISVLLLVLLAVNWAVLFLLGDSSLSINWPRRVASVMTEMFRGQAVLLAIWASFARGPLPWRLSGMLAGISLCEIPLCLLVSIERFSTEIAMFIVHELAQVIHIVAILSVARCCGVGLELRSNEDFHETVNSAKPRYQFSLRYLLWWTTGLAVLLSMIQCIGLFPEDSGNVYWLFIWFWRNHSLGMISIALIALAAVWAALGSRWLVLRVILLGAVSQATLPDVYIAKWPDSVIFSNLPFIAWLTGSLLIFRVVGYRIVWRRPMWWVTGAKRSDAPEIDDS